MASLVILNYVSPQVLQLSVPCLVYKQENTYFTVIAFYSRDLLKKKPRIIIRYTMFREEIPEQGYLNHMVVAFTYEK